jgi:hypothetical protein
LTELSSVPQRKRVEFSVLGVCCRVVGLRSTLEQWVRRQWEQACAIGAGHDYRIDLARCTGPPARATERPTSTQTTPLDGANLAWTRHGARWWSTGDDDRGVSLRLFDRRARIRIWSGDTRVESETLLALHVAFCEALRARGLVPLHAAVAVRDGCATALMGSSGVGKSTTLLAAVDDGWLPLAEDFAWLEPATRRVFCWSGEHGVRLDATGLSRLRANDRAAAWRPGADGKFELAYDAVARARPVSAELTRVVLLTRDESRESAIEALTPQSAARALWESAGVPLCRVNREAFAAHVPALLATLKWQRLTLGLGRATL